jgi:hypothetical protein
MADPFNLLFIPLEVHFRLEGYTKHSKIYELLSPKSRHFSRIIKKFV